MPQSSLMTWLGKPAAVNESPSKPTTATKPEARETHPAPHKEEALSEQSRNAELEKSAKSFLKGRGGSKPPLPPNVEIRGPTKEDMPAFKQLNSLLLPIPYPETFYKEILAEEVDRSITLMALWHDSPADIGKVRGRLVGAIRCRLFAKPPGNSSSRARKEGPMLYLSTLVLLSPYRGHGIAAHMLDNLIRTAVDDYEITSVGAHVWTANEEGLEWYRKRGFREVNRETGYYRRLNPTDAVVMLRDVGVMDLAGN